MRIAFDVPIKMGDGLVLRADVFLPQTEGRFPALLSYGPYGKGLAFQQGYKTAWDLMCRDNPDAVAGSSNRYANWEVVDPEKWVPDGYAVIRVDSRGAGRSPGFLCHNNARETQDIHDCIEWAALQPWCTGKVGMNGISYYASNQWRAAATQPPHLAAICVWEGWADAYRDGNRHGGIICVFRKNWQEMQVKTVQHGVGDRGARSAITGDTVCGPETLTDAELAANREDMWHELLSREMDDPYYQERTADLDKVTVPVLTAANWGGQGLHTRGNFEGFMRAASTQKWLEVHGGSHWAPFYTDYGVNLQKKFFGHFLKGENTGWDRQPEVLLQVRHVPENGRERFVERHEHEWPLARTRWTQLYLDPSNMLLSITPPAQDAAVTYDASGDGVTFSTPPLTEDTEITGPSALRLSLSSSTTDADLFVVLRVFDPDSTEVVFQGALDPHTPIAQGWLRASHRKTDPARSLPYRPWHTHDEKQPLKPGAVVPVDVEIWPTCIVVPQGYRIALTIRGKDYVWDGAATTLSNMKNPMRGCGPFEHDDPTDRPPEIFSGKVTLHTGPSRPAILLLPVIPPGN
ncbi:MAG: CocE/NonD family hydrolase [Betaproteobacteria bacterium]|jgi:predicted acyl esterase|nr:CocE/NonD family hydrolase [Betaproteobacteria bacterium]MDH4292630.1 CocE/NonD family hydrolase [Betaproteobacteria bacterium]MDH5341586.1 CocE/NonD family hydrolase [Betaproteobacteria bacterium]